MTTIAMLGTGIMASALTVPLADKGHASVWSARTSIGTSSTASRPPGSIPGCSASCPKRSTLTSSKRPRTAFDGAEVALSGVNSFGVHWAGQQLARLLGPGCW